MSILESIGLTLLAVVITCWLFVSALAICIGKEAGKELFAWWRANRNREIPNLPLEEAKAIHEKVAGSFDDLRPLKEALTQDELATGTFPPPRELNTGTFPVPPPVAHRSIAHLRGIDGGKS